MLKKIISPSSNKCDSVEFILRGARKRRAMAITAAREISSDAGIKTTFAVVKYFILLYEPYMLKLK